MSIFDHNVCCTKLPISGLAALAPLRCAANVTVRIDGKWAWLHWQAANDDVLNHVLPVPGVTLYERRDEEWYRYGSHLPAADVPDSADGRPLRDVLIPGPLQTVKPRGDRMEPVILRLVADHRPRSTTALGCGLGDVLKWADTVSSTRLESIRAAHCSSQVMLLGTRLPLIPGCKRFWGSRVLVPLGFRLEPDLPESAIVEALGIANDELLLMDSDGGEVISTEALQPLSRTGIRLAVGETR
jgi:MoxR-vWA-beta-propeller ternary system domain bpX2